MSYPTLALFALAGGLSLMMAPMNTVGFRSPLWSSTLMSLPAYYVMMPAAMAAWAAWQSRRMAIAAAYLMSRSKVHVLLRWLITPIWVALVLPPLTVLVLAPLRVGRPVSWDLLMIPVTSMLMIAWTTAGAVLGRFLPTPVAVPGALLAAYVGVSFAESWSDFVPRHVLGLHSTCCAIETAVAPVLPLTSLTFYTVVAGVLAVVLLRPDWVSLLAALLAITTAYALAGRIVVAVDNPQGTVPRPPAQLVCRGERPVTCLWPEQEPQRAAVVSAAQQITRELTALGISVPSTVSPLLNAEWIYYGQTSTSRTLVQRTLVGGITYTPMPECANRQPWTYPDIIPDLNTWVWLRSGFDAKMVTPSKRLADVLRRPLPQQVEWFTRNRAQRDRCLVQPVR